MVRMKLRKEEFDPKALDIPQEETTFKRYRGEMPKNGTILIFRVTKMWWTQAKSGASQIFLMAFAEQNTGQLAKFNGLPIRDYLTFQPESAFRYMNFLNCFGLTTRDIYAKMDVEPEPDDIGDIINSIADWVVGSDDALCRIAVVRDHYNPDEDRVKVDRDGWMPLDDEEDDEDEEDEDEQPARPARGSRQTKAPARGARAASSRSRRAEPEPDEDDDEDIDDEDEDVDDEAEDQEDDEDDEAEEEDDEEGEDEAEEEPPARPARRSGNRSRASSSSRTRPASARRGSSGASSRADGERTGTRRSSATTERTPGPRGSKGRDGGSREDPPF